MFPCNKKSRENVTMASATPSAAIRNTVILRSRKMLTLDSRIGRALTSVLISLKNRQLADEERQSLVAKEGTTVVMTRKNMNLFEFSLLRKDRSRRRRRTAARRCNMKLQKNDNTSVIMRLISVVMQDAQQRNLNAKHSAAATTTVEGGGGGGGCSGKGVVQSLLTSASASKQNVKGEISTMLTADDDVVMSTCT